MLGVGLIKVLELKLLNEISKSLELANEKLDLNIFKERKTQAQENTKLAVNLLNIIKDIDINRISPIQAFDILGDLISRAKEDK